jgi:hypothetical protein
MEQCIRCWQAQYCFQMFRAMEPMLLPSVELYPILILKVVPAD